MAETVTIKVEPSPGGGEHLTVRDAMRQVLEFIELMAASAPEESQGAIEWELVSATTNSPFTAVAEAISVDIDQPDVAPYVRQAKAAMRTTIEAAINDGVLPDWIGQGDRSRIVSIFERNMAGVGRTTISFDDGQPPVVIVERVARTAVENITLAQSAEVDREQDYSGQELGSIDGQIIEATKHRGTPALRIRDRVTGDKVICLLSAELAKTIGQDVRIGDVWTGQRVMASGLLTRSADGTVTSIKLESAEDLIEIMPRNDTLASLLDKNFTGGRGVRDYLDDNWSGPLGEG
ncbi:hypothetical protein D3C72_669210 [compost metagenome]